MAPNARRSKRIKADTASALPVVAEPPKVRPPPSPPVPSPPPPPPAAR